MYPGGATPAGVYDLAGNVWEWTSTSLRQYGAYCIKGGGWWSDVSSAKASAADGPSAYVRGNDYGFRVGVVPLSRSA